MAKRREPPVEAPDRGTVRVPCVPRELSPERQGLPIEDVPVDWEKFVRSDTGVREVAVDWDGSPDGAQAPEGRRVG